MNIDEFVNTRLQKKYNPNISKKDFFQLFHDIGIEKQTVYLRLRGERQFTFYELCKLCNLLKCDMNTLTSALIYIIQNYNNNNNQNKDN